MVRTNVTIVVGATAQSTGRDVQCEDPLSKKKGSGNPEVDSRNIVEVRQGDGETSVDPQFRTDLLILLIRRMRTASGATGSHRLWRI